jgi:hypothetical protein
MFENRVFRRIFRPKRNNVIEEYRKLHNEKLNDLYSSPNIVQVKIKNNGKGTEKVYSTVWWGNLRERDHLEDLGADGRIILRWIFRKWVVGA